MYDQAHQQMGMGMGMPPGMPGMPGGAMPGPPMMGPGPGMDQSALMSILLAILGQQGMGMGMGGGGMMPPQLTPPVMPPM